eukprot:scaffold7029_cov375-Pinguiococcus_pyrenoidosus.AAC.1
MGGQPPITPCPEAMPWCPVAARQISPSHCRQRQAPCPVPLGRGAPGSSTSGDPAYPSWTRCGSESSIYRDPKFSPRHSRIRDCHACRCTCERGSRRSAGTPVLQVEA